MMKMSYFTKISAVMGAVLALNACVPIVDNAGKPVPVVVQTAEPVLVVKTQDPWRLAPNMPIHVCTLKPFIDTYRGEDINRGKAKLSAQKQCLASNNAMFCQEKDIQCTEYK